MDELTKARYARNYPRIHPWLMELCDKAELYERAGMDRELRMPEGVTWRGRDFVNSTELIAAYGLHQELLYERG